MVLERIFPADWLERKPLYAFVLGVVYALIGIIAARLLFPRDPALVAVAFISILLLPQLNKIFAIEERQQRAEKRFSWKHLWRDDRDVLATYIMLFLGIFLVYVIATIWMPAYQINTLFQQQLAYRGGTGFIPPAATLFVALLANNFIVLLAVFIIGLLAGDGAIFLITWNASVWGTIFAATARDAGAILGLGALPVLVMILLIVLPHVLLEAGSYIMAAISGSVMSKDIEQERHKSKAFHTIFKYNAMLLLVAFIVLIVGVAVETFILTNSGLYQEIIQASLYAR